MIFVRPLIFPKTHRNLPETFETLLNKLKPLENHRMAVVKPLKTTETYINSLIDNGFTIKRVLEPEVAAEFMSHKPELAEESRRPPFLVISSEKIM